MMLKGIFEEDDGLLSRDCNQWLPLTELTVNFTNVAIKRDLGRVDMFTASEFLARREISPEVMITALMYVSRYKKRKDAGQFSSKMNGSFTSADLFLVSMMMASKYLFDDGIEENVINEEWAEDFGIETEEINALEIDFLINMDWRLFVSEEDYKVFKTMIGRYVWLYLWNSHSKSGATYCELTRMSDYTKDKVYEIVRLICSAVVGCTLVYAGMVLSAHILMAYSLHSDIMVISPQLSFSDVYKDEAILNNTQSAPSNMFKDINLSHNDYTLDYPRYVVNHKRTLRLVL